MRPAGLFSALAPRVWVGAPEVLRSRAKAFFDDFEARLH